jgi:hypothetical protein
MSAGATWANGDFNGDYQVTDADAAILAAHWHEGAESESSVPEPATTVLVAAGLLALLAFGNPSRAR